MVRALAQPDRSALRFRRFRAAPCLAAWLLCACGRIGYDELGGVARSDASTENPDASLGDGAVSSGSDVSQDRPVAPGDDAGGDVPGTVEGSDEGGGPVDGPPPDQVGVSTDAASCGSGLLSLLHWNVSPSSPTSAMDMEFKVTNRTGQTIPVSSLKLRYYLTNEFTAARLETYYTEICCSAPRTGFNANVVLALQPITSPTNPTATSYIEMGFDNGAGTVVDGDTVKLEIGLVNGNELETQTNDYSYVPTATGTQSQWDQCPSAPGGPRCAKYFSCVTGVYKDGVLLWGMPP